MGFSLLLLSGLLIVASTGNGFVLKRNETEGKSKIEGGEHICINRVPYQVYLKENENLICGGVLIKPDIVLTSAHCVEDLSGHDVLSIVAGTDSPTMERSATKSKEGVKIYSEFIVMHQMYDSGSLELAMKYDIAIIKLRKSFTMTNRISTIGLPTRPVRRGEKLLLTGIGAVGDQFSCLSPYLKAYVPNVINCENYLPNIKPLLTNFHGIVCHTSYAGHRSRAGDSGGPLVNSRRELAGIHRGSATENCQVGVDVFHLLDWIKDTVEMVSYAYTAF